MDGMREPRAKWRPNLTEFRDWCHGSTMAMSKLS
jgi:hypothetical protein